MKRGWLIVLIVAVCAVVAIVAALVWPGEKEPVYQGKKLSEWIDQAWRASGREQEARFAIRQIGTNAFPVLVKWIESADASSGTWMEDVADKMSVSAGPALGNFRRRKFQRAKAAVEAFQFLGRSEEHTSELQSRFGISYAVFCLKN